jgi:hypothetical protein
VKVLLQYIWEKEPFENGKHDKKFDGYEQPELFAHTHVGESVIVKMIDPFEK